MTAPPPGSHHVLDIVEQLDALTGRETVSVGDVLEAFGPTAFVPVMMVPALLVISPLSGIPLFSSICGLIIALIASQLLLRRPTLWLPSFLVRRQIAGPRLHRGVRRIRGLANWIDRHTHDRMRAFASAGARPGIYAACLFAGAAMPLLEVVPFSSSVLGMAVLCLSAGLLAADGLLVVVALVFIGVAAAIPLTVLGSVVAG